MSDEVLTDSGHRIGDPCEAIIAEFVYGPMTCMKTSVAIATDATWGTTHVACFEHAARSIEAAS